MYYVGWELEVSALLYYNIAVPKSKRGDRSVSRGAGGDQGETFLTPRFLGNNLLSQVMTLDILLYEIKFPLFFKISI